MQSARGSEVMDRNGVASQSELLLDRGFVVLESLPPAAVRDARNCILENAGLLKNTRPNPYSGHLAGFHRYPQLEHLHGKVSSNPTVLEILKLATGSSLIRSIGLSDITVNRSQHWHVDLLRGPYQSHLTPQICWGPLGGGVYKVLLYLQPGSTLRVVPGAHTKAVPLDDDRRSEPRTPSETEEVEVAAGNIVLMDIRLPHRGSSEEELLTEACIQSPKILVSTVLAGNEKPLGNAMELGNLQRLLDWDEKHRHRPKPQLFHAKELAGITVQR